MFSVCGSYRANGILSPIYFIITIDHALYIKSIKTYEFFLDKDKESYHPIIRNYTRYNILTIVLIDPGNTYSPSTVLSRNNPTSYRVHTKVYTTINKYIYNIIYSRHICTKVMLARAVRLYLKTQYITHTLHSYYVLKQYPNDLFISKTTTTTQSNL